MLKKIRFVNPIKECLNIQGKGYTLTLIATIVASLMLSLIAVMMQMPIAATVAGIAGIGSIIGFGWWFGVEPISQEEKEF